MNVLNNSEFAKQVMAHANPSDKFEPQVYYDSHTDSLEFVLKPDDFYAERIDQLVTVYYSRKNGELIGSFLKGVKGILKNNPRLNILVQENGKIKLAHILIARIAMEQNTLKESVTIVYNRLIKQAEDNEVEFEMCSTT